MSSVAGAYPLSRSSALRAAAAWLLAALLLLAASITHAAPTYPALSGRVTDAANVLPPATVAELTAKLEALETATGRQLVVATVPSLEDYPIEDYANGLFRAWKLGEAKTNNGVLLLVRRPTARFGSRSATASRTG